MLARKSKADRYNEELLKHIINSANPLLVAEEPPRRRIEEEHEIQRSCVNWFRMQYSRYAKLLFAIPNGGGRSKREAGRLKAEGVVAGVADLCLAVPRGGYGALYIEMKQKGNYQQQNQKEWQKIAVENGNLYVVCKSIDEFMFRVNEYLRMPKNADLMRELEELRKQKK